jgi:hypothetical protein
MGINYVLQAVVVSDGNVKPLGTPGSKAVIEAGMVSDIIEKLAPRIRRGSVVPFPWAEPSRVFQDGRNPGPYPDDCFDPRDVLSDLQDMEADVAEHPMKYPAHWRFTYPGTSNQNIMGVRGTYNGRHCMLFGDDKGLWAREISTGPREGVHHELTGAETVRMTLEPPIGEVDVRVIRHPVSLAFKYVVRELREVCDAAIDAQALVLPIHR